MTYAEALIASQDALVQALQAHGRTTHGGSVFLYTKPCPDCDALIQAYDLIEARLARRS